jgi:hypothetical protein
MRLRFLSCSGLSCDGSSIAGDNQFLALFSLDLADEPLRNSPYSGDCKDSSSSLSMCNVSRITDGHLWASSGSISLRRQVNTFENIEPPAYRVGAKASAYEITLSGLKPRINSHLLRVDFFLNFTSSESNLESFGPSNIVMIFLLKTAGYFNRPFAKRSPLDDCALNLCPSLSFYARSVRDFFSTRISS